MTEHTIRKVGAMLLLNKEFSYTEKDDIVIELSKSIKEPLEYVRTLSEAANEHQYTCPRCHEGRYITNVPRNDFPHRCSYCGQRFDWKEFKKQEQNDGYFNNRGEVDDD